MTQPGEGRPLDGSGAGGRAAEGSSPADGSTADPSPADPSAAEPSAAEPSAAEPSAAEPSPAEPSPAEPSPAEPSPAAAAAALLGPAEVRALAAHLGLRPTKSLGQNFVIDANTVRRIVRVSGVGADDVVLEVGPGLGSLTLALLERAQHVVAVEVDRALAGQLPITVRDRAPALADRLTVVPADALRMTDLPLAPTALVANLPYNISVPVLLHLLATFPTLERALVMVQLEVAERLAAPPGSRVYGVPSVKARWFADVRQAGLVGRSVFWPVPNVDSGLVELVRTSPPREDVERAEVFAVVDAAFAQRRKMLRSALSGWAGSSERAVALLEAAGVDPTARGESLGVAQFASIAAAASGTSG